ncbi:hypothetical protein [Pseudomonas aeruginosa]|uniref:hypothetical protein n=1 Tax=Pseudomonas aeruginosa TaxID=287 RepID=UPI0034E09FC6
MKFVLLFTAVISTNDGAALTKLSQEFDSKKACVAAMQADSGQEVDTAPEYPTVRMAIASRYADRYAESNYQKWVCVPKGE